MKVLKNYLYNAIYQLFKVIIPVVTIPYLSRVLGPKGIGINSYTNSVIQFFILIGDLGITVYGEREVAYVRNNRYKLSQTFYEIMILQICTLTVSYICFFIFLTFTNQYQLFYLAQSILIIAWALDISWFFMGIENFRITVFRNFVVRILILICIFVFVKDYSDLLIYIILYGLSFLIGNITLFIGLKKYIDGPNLKKLHILKHLKPAITLFIPNIAMEIYLVLNKTMLGLFDGVKASGFYDQSNKVVKMILAVVTATGTVMLPHVAHAFANGEKTKTQEYLCDSFSFVTALAVAMTCGLAAIAPDFVPLFFGSKFLIVIPLMMIESLVIVLIGWGNVIGTQYLLPTKQTKEFTISVTVGSIINIIINVPLILLFGVIGSVIATVISELCVTSSQLFMVRKQISFKRLFSNWYKYFISGIIMFSIVSYVNKILSVTWITIFLDIIIGSIVYVLLIIFMKSNIIHIVKVMMFTNY